MVRHLGIKVEPYWNVNRMKKDKLRIVYKIKVEPYWNVKLNRLYL